MLGGVSLAMREETEASLIPLQVVSQGAGWGGNCNIFSGRTASDWQRLMGIAKPPQPCIPVHRSGQERRLVYPRPLIIANTNLPRTSWPQL